MFQGNGVYLDQGKAVIPAGGVADRLMAGNFGPSPSQTAPPGFILPEVRQAMAEALQSPVAPQQPPQAPGGNNDQLATAIGLAQNGILPPGYLRPNNPLSGNPGLTAAMTQFGY